MNKPAHPEVRPKLLDFCIGLIEDLYGRPDTYEELKELLEREFPQEQFTLDEIINLYGISREQEDLDIQMGRAMLYDRDLYEDAQEYLKEDQHGSPETQQPGMF